MQFFLTSLILQIWIRWRNTKVLKYTWLCALNGKRICEKSRIIPKCQAIDHVRDKRNYFSYHAWTGLKVAATIFSHYSSVLIKNIT